MSPADPFLHGARLYVPVPSDTLIAAHEALARAFKLHPMDYDIATALGRICVYLPTDHAASASILQFRRNKP